ncbi:hypothetical protein GCM10022244_48310 [Streptomyces gulbargensis]|uniref:Uncharacterized protein n=1 Tax=Streptomyces gulbargensis TaxID=364901 RepID=A0ABP7N0W4_9ACTN
MAVPRAGGRVAVPGAVPDDVVRRVLLGAAQQRADGLVGVRSEEGGAGVVQEEEPSGAPAPWWPPSWPTAPA